MSLVFITRHNETIYNIVKEQVSEDLKPDFSRKSYNKSRPFTGARRRLDSIPAAIRIEPNTFVFTSSKKYLHKTMGYAETPLHPPNDYLKKNEGVKWIRSTDHKCLHKDLPPIPKLDQKSNYKEEKDFKMVNIKKVVCKPPRRTEPKYAFTRTGDVRVLCKSGIQPAYIFHPNYGKVPKYILTRKTDIISTIKAEEQVHEKVQDFKIIPSEERQKLLIGLKSNWLELQKKYQVLPVCTDTIPKKKRKSDLEKELRQLEKDILLIESNPLLYVCPDGSPKDKDFTVKHKHIIDVSTDSCLK